MNIFIYILDTLADWEIGYIIAELNSGRFFKKGFDPLKIIKVGHSLDPIKTMGGLEIHPDKLLEQTQFKANDILILPGADTWLDDVNIPVLGRVKGLLDQKISVAAICGATMAMANHGLLDSRKHTSNDKDYLKNCCPGYSGGSNYIQAPVVVDGNLITASGLAALEFSFEVFKKTGCFYDDTLQAWYDLYFTKEPECYFRLMQSLHG